MGDAVLVATLQLLCFPGGIYGGNLLGAAESVSFLLAPMCCRFWGTLAT